MGFPFAKYTGCGNDFILIDDRTASFPFSDKKLITRLCHRQYGIGADGLILLQKSFIADHRMRIFNSDSSEAEMCGNGIRCLAQFIHKLFPTNKQFKIETLSGIYDANVEPNGVRIEMILPKNLKTNISLRFQEQNYLTHYVDTGVPHVVAFTDKLNQINLAELGPFIRNHQYFKPQGTNVNFAEKISKNAFKIRTYERGVEKETLACGTGATATAIIANIIYGISSPIELITKSDERLLIDFSKNNHFQSVSLIGPAVLTFEGFINM